MQLKVLLPTQVLLETTVSKVIVEAENGSLCLLPKHIDFVTALAPGLLTYWNSAGEHFLAIDGGSLVKVGAQVLVSTQNAVANDNLEILKAAIAQAFHTRDEQERQAKTALGRLEAAALQHFLELKEGLHG